MGRNIGNSTNQIFLISDKYNEAVIPIKYKDSVCFYDETKKGR